jgi:hypothetical protein
MCKKIALLKMQNQNSFLKLSLVICFMMACFNSFGQHQHFIYLQQEPAASFYVKYQGQIYRSSAQGYLILSKIPKGEMVFYMGLGVGSQQELKFILDSVSSDKGFLIKKFGDKGWGLFDLQQTTVVYAIQQPRADVVNGSKIFADTAVNDAFGNMLSDITKDTTVKYVTVKKSEVMPVQAVASTLTGKTTSDTVNTIKPNANNESGDTVTRRNVQNDILLLGREEKAGFIALIFSVPIGQKTDTVVAEIDHSVNEKAIDKSILPKKSKGNRIAIIDANMIDTLQTSTISVGANSDSAVSKVLLVHDTIQEVIIQQDAQQSNKQQVQMDTLHVQSDELIVPAVKDVLPEQRDSLKTKSASLPSSSKDCKQVADDDVFIRLRKKMAGRRTEAQMIEEVIKGCKQTCYTTLQIGQLSGLLMSDEMRYRFFDAALKCVVDPGAYASLGKYIQDPYYKKRFDALIPNP